jgi:hypothetical protein
MPTEFKDFFFHVGAVFTAFLAAFVIQGFLEFFISQFHNSDFYIRFFSFVGIFVCCLIVVIAYLSTPEGKHFRLYSIGLADPITQGQLQNLRRYGQLEQPPEPENVVILIDAKDHVRDASPSVPQSSSQPSSRSPAAQKIADEIARRRGS